MNKMDKNDYILLMEGSYARICNQRIGKNGEPTINLMEKTDRLLLLELI